MYKQHSFTIALISCLCLGLFMSSCSDDSEEYFKIKVDTLITADTVLSSDSIVIGVKGFIGSDLCYVFERFEDIRSSLKVDLTVWGKHWLQGPCLQALSYLDETYIVRNLVKGEFLIVIHQPDGSQLKKTVIIR